MSRTDFGLLPAGGETLHLIGDLHNGVVKTWRIDKLLADIQTMPLNDPLVGHLAIGDLTQNALTSEDALALAFLNGLPFAWHPVLGGHDILNNVRTPAQWAAVYGVPSQNYVVDFASFRLVVLGPNKDGTLAQGGGVVLWRNTYTWAERRIAEVNPKPCILATHAPVQNTVGGSDAVTYYTSVDPAWSTQPDLDIKVVIARHPNLIAWLSGHTHSSLDAPGFVTTIPQADGRNFVAINGSSPYYQDRPGATDNFSPIQSVYVTVLEDRLQVRWRDHGAGVWVGPSASGRVVEVMFRQPAPSTSFPVGSPSTLLAPSRRMAPL